MYDRSYDLYKDEDAPSPGPGSYLLENSALQRWPLQSDKFLVKIYNYFEGKGFKNIILAKIVNLITVLWILIMTTFLSTFVNYSLLFSTYNFFDAVGFQGFPSLLLFCGLLMGCLFWFWQAFLFLPELQEFHEVKRFYEHELGISESLIQTIEWHVISEKICEVSRNNVTQLDLANRIMRRENYLIAMINKNLLPLYIPLPFVQHRNILTKTLEWGIKLAIFDYVFDPITNSLNHKLKDPRKASELAEGLKRRFFWTGVVGLVLAPFVCLYLVIWFFFMYGEEMRNRPTVFAMRQWSPLARWKFRELNELPHVFQRRLQGSYKLAEKFVTAFPVTTIAILARCIAFIVGSVVAVLIVFGLYDDEILFKMEVFEGRSGIWMVTVGGAILAGTRAMIPDENLVSDPTLIMQQLVQYTHFMPSTWANRTNTLEVLQDFTELFQYRIIVFLTEVLSVLFAPFILLFSLPRASEHIIDFFREFTVAQSGVGDICKFAVFPLQDLGSKKFGLADPQRRGKAHMKGGKLEKSFLNFKANHPGWKPSAEGERYLGVISQISEINPVSRSSPDSVPAQRFVFSDTNVPVTHTEPEDQSTLRQSLSGLNKIHRAFFQSQLHHSDHVRMRSSEGNV